MAKKKNSRLADTEATKGRGSRAHQLEVERLELKEEIEAIMTEYARLTGIPDFKARRYKVGKAPNDYKAEK